MRVLITAAAFTAALAACSGSTTTDSAPTTPPPSASADVGETLYQAHCAECHGSDLRGTDRGPSHLSRIYEPGHHGDGAFVFAVTRGSPQHHWNFGPMPPIEGLDLEDIAAITSYVRLVQETEGFEG